MHPHSRFSLLVQVLTVVIFSGVLGANALRAQEGTAPKTVLDFEGNKVVSKPELLEIANKCLDGYSKVDNQDEALDYCLHKVSEFLHAKGYLQARLGKPRLEQTENGSRTIVSVHEGAVFRLGEVTINGARILAPSQIRELFELKKGDIANGETIGVWLFERTKKAYGNLGYIQYTAEVQPTFHCKEGEAEGVADLEVTIDEGPVFTIASIKFEGAGNVPRDVLLREIGLRNGDVFSQDSLEDSLKRLSENGRFETIDTDRDVDFWWDQKVPQLKLTIHLKKKVAELAPLPGTVRGAIAIQPD